MGYTILTAHLIDQSLVGQWVYLHRENLGCVFPLSLGRPCHLNIHAAFEPDIILKIVMTSSRRSWYHFLFVHAEIQSRQRLIAYGFSAR